MAPGRPQQGKLNGWPVGPDQLQRDGIKPRTGCHPFQQLGDQRHVFRHHQIEECIAHQGFRRLSDQRVGRAGGEDNLVGRIDLEQQIGGAKCKRDEPIAISSQALDISRDADRRLLQIFHSLLRGTPPVAAVRKEFKEFKAPI